MSTSHFCIKLLNLILIFRFVLSKGHAAPILYAAWAEAGLFPTSELMNLRKLPNDLEGHPTPRLSFIDCATGSLGQGLSIACGMAYCGKHFDKADYRTYCLLGDGETAEGNVWEGFAFAGFYKLDNLCVIIDCNRLGQSRPTQLAHDINAYKKRIESFDVHCVVCDGHNIDEIIKCFQEACCTKGKTTCIVAKTMKGKNFPEVEDKENWHGKPLGDKSEAAIKCLECMIKNKNVCLKVTPKASGSAPCCSIRNVKLSSPPCYNLGESIATRASYGAAMAKLVKGHPRVVALDADMKNSTFAEKVLEVDPNRHIECFIAEQSMIGVAIGIACRNRCVAFASTFAAFLCRAYDQVRMGAISQTNINIMGSHCGVSIGEDGPSQMALEDLAMFRAIPTCTVFYPSDAVSCERACELAANTEGICYIRCNRAATDVIYKNEEQFQVGVAKVIEKSNKDQVLVIAGGITIKEALKAAKELKNCGVHIRIIDLFTVKPIDQKTILCNAKECCGKILTVEDHYPEGGIGEAVLSAVAEHSGIIVKKIGIPKVPRSGPPDQLLDYYGISAKHIITYVKCLAGSRAEGGEGKKKCPC